MKEGQPISAKLNSIKGEVSEYLKGNPEDFKGLQVEFYAGVPITDVLKILAGAAGTAVAAIGTLKALKTIPSGYEGVRVTLGKVHGKPLNEGPALTDPTRKIQRIALVDMTPREIDLPAAVKSFTRDGTQITTDVTAVLRVGGSKDMVRITHPRPVIRVDDDPRMRKIVAGFADALAREVVAETTTSELTQAQTLKSLREGSKILLQRVLDGTFLDEEGMREVSEKLSQGMPREEIKRGVIVQQVAFPGLEFSPEVVEAMQERVGAPMRVEAEKMLQEALGADYAVARRSQAAEQVARTPDATIVFGVGTADGGVLGRMRRLEEKLGSGSGPESIEEIRERIDRLRGEGG